MSLSYVRDIRPLFRDLDIDAMRPRGYDLASYEDVSANADIILSRLKDGTMPCDGAWPDSQVQTFEQWIADGKLP